MKAFPLLLAACLATAVVLAGCAASDDESTDGTGDQSGRELNQDIVVEGNGSTNDTMETNETGG